MESFATDLRAVAGRFCQQNCFQEALLPVLASHHNCDPISFPVLRWIGWEEIGSAVAQGVPPGLFGGLSAEQMTRIYSIEWARAPAGLPVREQVSYLASIGAPICKVDRFFVPPDQGWYRQVHQAHSLLVVGFDASGVQYSDADFPEDPAHLSWAEFEAALLRDGDREIAFARAVQRCTDLGPADRARLEKDFLAAATAGLTTRPDRVADVAEQLIRRLAAVDPAAPGGMVDAVEAGAFLNAVAVSLTAAAALAGDRSPDAEAFLRRAGKGVDLCVTRALAYSETFRPRHLERLRDCVGMVVALWASDERAAALAALKEHGVTATTA